MSWLKHFLHFLVGVAIGAAPMLAGGPVTLGRVALAATVGLANSTAHAGDSGSNQ